MEKRNKKTEILIIDTQLVSKKEYTRPTLVWPLLIESTPSRKVILQVMFRWKIPRSLLVPDCSNECHACNFKSN